MRKEKRISNGVEPITLAHAWDDELGMDDGGNWPVLKEAVQERGPGKCVYRGAKVNKDYVCVAYECPQHK